MPAILVDASGYIYRAFFTQPDLRMRDGTAVGCIHGYLRMLWNARRRYADATHFAVCFDKGKSADRIAIWPEYKAQRKPMHPDLASQLGMVRDATRAFGFPVVEQQGIEADDLIASYAETLHAAGEDVIILSSDKDLMQMIREGIGMFCPLKEKRLGLLDVLEKFGTAPKLVPDAQGLIGDTSDNIPGVPKIGPKTAHALLARYGTLENVLQYGPGDEAFGPAVRNNLLVHAEQARMSRRLATLRRDVPLPLPIDDIQAGSIDAEGLLGFARGIQLDSFAADVAAYYRLENAA